MSIRLSFVLMLFITIVFSAGSAVAGSFQKNAFEGKTNTGSFRDRCLNDQIPVTIKKLDTNRYFVRVKNRYSGEVQAGSYGEARNIACSRKTHLILYNSEK